MNTEDVACGWHHLAMKDGFVSVAEAMKAYTAHPAVFDDMAATIFALAYPGATDGPRLKSVKAEAHGDGVRLYVEHTALTGAQ